MFGHAPGGMSSDSHNCWVFSILIIKFDEKEGQMVQNIFPPNSIDSELLTDLRMLSMPDCLEPGSRHEFQFIVRARDKKDESMNKSFFYCYVAFRQCRDSSTNRGYFQQSVMIVSKLTYANLFLTVLERLVDVLAEMPEFEQILNSSGKEDNLKVDSLLSNTGVLNSTLEVAFRHFALWPMPIQGINLRLPFFGNIISFTVPHLPAYFDGDHSFTRNDKTIL
jgi:hypothetical protein